MTGVIAGRSTGAYLGAGGLSNTRAGYNYRDDMDTGQNEALERDVVSDDAFKCSNPRIC